MKNSKPKEELDANRISTTSIVHDKSTMKDRCTYQPPKTPTGRIPVSDEHIPKRY